MCAMRAARPWNTADPPASLPPWQRIDASQGELPARPLEVRAPGGRAVGRVKFPPVPAPAESLTIMSDPDRLVAACFHVLAEASPGLLNRLLQPLAKRDLVPDRLQAWREGETMRVEIALDAMPAGMVHLVAGNLGQVIGVMALRQDDAGALRAA
jgi:hypothetical protein